MAKFQFNAEDDSEEENNYQQQEEQIQVKKASKNSNLKNTRSSQKNKVQKKEKQYVDDQEEFNEMQDEDEQDSNENDMEEEKKEEYSDNDGELSLNQLKKKQNQNQNQLQLVKKESAQKNKQDLIKQKIDPMKEMMYEYEKEIEENDLYPKLQNIVATVNLCCKLDLQQIAISARNTEYNPKRFAAVIMRLRDPKTTALIFSSGKMVCTGAKTEQESNRGARKYAKIIKKLGFNVKFTEFKIQNIVGSTDVGFPINLDNLEHDHKKFVSYEPEIFPGLIYREHQTQIVLLIFVSGKIVLTGAKTREKIVDAFKKIYAVLKQYMKKDFKPKNKQKYLQNADLPQISNNSHNHYLRSHGKQA
ncbi:hypothetical protein PPERSA_00991 [Pseudocohnilembus persalinus]|uniref:Uncharacterized protein n=1 Tax=Pseudocohnilembus persalinus TaxID=266149 RepID=A0A0V0R994_PSEPJ|nr:hypothetical protein PPERSA_00991 [Pseudocohnilembus persalinus]|eukprot:KRX10821.1 hypothetical protein PPERSA_00991 [Pseudocohnilembus persalinus]